jgi:ribosomal protein S18 acetylase RimI-like enzyme
VRAIHFREARATDVQALSRLLVSLYEHEAPGMLAGSFDARAAVTGRLLASEPPGRRLIAEAEGIVVGTGSIATMEAPRPPVPPSVVLSAPAVVGPLNGLCTIVGALRGLATITAPPAAEEALLHSLVVSDECQRQGIGRALLQQLETLSRTAHKRRVVLQVVAANTGARDFYRGAGYVEQPRHLTPAQRWLGFPSVVMSKKLDEAESRPLSAD